MQGDLISRSASLEEMHKYVDNDLSIHDIELLEQIIGNMPVVYDADKVIEQLENASHWTENTFDEDGYSNDDSDEVVYLQTAIKIVTNGGKE